MWHQGIDNWYMRHATNVLSKDLAICVPCCLLNDHCLLAHEIHFSMTVQIRDTYTSDGAPTTFQTHNLTKHVNAWTGRGEDYLL